jgi:hypothetical protein
LDFLLFLSSSFALSSFFLCSSFFLPLFFLSSSLLLSLTLSIGFPFISFYLLWSEILCRSLSHDWTHIINAISDIFHF